MPRAFAVFTAACLVVAVVTQTVPLTRTLRWFAGEAARTEPYELRLRLNDWLGDAVVAARTIAAEVPAPLPVLLHTGSEAWFVGLRLQPRRVYLDGPAIRARLEEAGEAYVVVHLQRVGDRTWWWFQVDDGRGGLRRVGQPPPAITRDGFEDGVDGWLAVGAREHRE